MSQLERESAPRVVAHPDSWTRGGVGGGTAWRVRDVVTRLVGHATGRFLLLVALMLLYYLTYEFAPWSLPGEPVTLVPVTLLPILVAAWNTATWVLFSVGLFFLLGWRSPPSVPTSDVGMRRIALVAVTLVLAFESGVRLATVGLYGVEARVGAELMLAAALGGAALLAVLLRWPPPTPVLLALLLSGGLAARAMLLALGPQARNADNLAVIAGGLERLLSGQTPYASVDLGTHSNYVHFLPWTLLSYLPAFVVGLDIGVTNIVLSLGLLLALGAMMWALRVNPTVRNGLLLALGVYWFLPINLGLDRDNEFQMFNLALVLAFGLIALQRLRVAALAYGLALGAMPLALFCAVPLLCFAVRTRPWRQTVALAAIVFAVGIVPILAFFAWDPQPFLIMVLSVPQHAWNQIDSGRVYWIQYTAWHHLLGSWLRFVQVGIFLGVAWFAWTRLRTVHDLVALSTVSYLALVLAGPYLPAHLLQVVPYLVVLAEVVRAAGLREPTVVR